MALSGDRAFFFAPERGLFFSPQITRIIFKLISGVKAYHSHLKNGMTCFMEHEDVSKQFETQRHKDTEFFILLIHKLIPSVSLCLRVLFFNFLRNLLLGESNELRNRYMVINPPADWNGQSGTPTSTPTSPVVSIDTPNEIPSYGEGTGGEKE